MWPIAVFGPMCDQAHHFVRHASDERSYAAFRYMDEVEWLLNILDARLKYVECLAE
jgi:hypothetical protein